MKLIAQVKLQVTPEQHFALLDTLQRANKACDALSAWAWEHQTFGQFAIHKAQYSSVRAEFDLTAQVVVRCISKVADAYKLDKATLRTFKPTGAIAYDDRILRWYAKSQAVSLWTTAGRITIPYSCGERQKEMLRTRQGESDLVFSNGSWFLLATCNLEDAPPITPTGVLGVDFGITEIAVDSEGNFYSGEPIKKIRRAVKRHRGGLQSCGTPSAKRRLCRIRRKQSRFVRDANHGISKKIVQAALLSCKAIALENLEGIRQRVSASKEMRWLLGNWAFLQLKQFVLYKAKLAGVPVVEVDAAYTSQTCSGCKHCERANRSSQSKFKCQKCGFVANADLNAAVNIKARGELSDALQYQATATACA